MSIIIVITCIALLITLISYFKVNAFLAFLLISILVGLLLGVDVQQLTISIQKGIGDMLGSLVIVLVCGAMLGKLVAESGAAQRIASSLMYTFGEKYIQWALMITGFIIGIPLFYNVGFVLVMPLIFSVVYRYKLPAVFIGLPMLAALSVTHGFLPPHPSPAGLIAQFKADMGKTLLYGVIIAIPTVILAGPVFARTLRGMNAPLMKTFTPNDLAEHRLPGLANSILSSLLPVILLTVTTISLTRLDKGSTTHHILLFVSDPAMVMIISLIVATFTLGVMQKISFKIVMDQFADAIKDIALLLLIISGAGALKQVLTDSGVSNEIAALLTRINVHPLVLGWIIACIIRVAVGSATVAGLTAAGIMFPFLSRPDVDANLMVLSIGAGSLMFSHVNDAGFWLFKEYFNLGIKDTIRSWSLMETIVAVAGLAGVLLINAFIH